MVPAATTQLRQLCHHSIKATTDNTCMNEYGYAPTELYLYIYQELNIIEIMGHEILLFF